MVRELARPRQAQQDYTDPLFVTRVSEGLSQKGYTRDQINTFINKKVTEAHQTEAIKSTGAYVPPEQASAMYRAGVTPKSAEQTEIEKEARKRETEQGEEYRKVSSLMKGMLTEYENIPESDKGPIQARMKGGTLKKGGEQRFIGQLFAPEAIEYEETRRALSGTLKELIGEEGRLTDVDIDRLVSMLPASTDTKRQRELAYDRISNLLSSTFGIPREETDEFLGVVKKKITADGPSLGLSQTNQYLQSKGLSETPPDLSTPHGLTQMSPVMLEAASKTAIDMISDADIGKSQIDQRVEDLQLKYNEEKSKPLGLQDPNRLSYLENRIKSYDDPGLLAEERARFTRFGQIVGGVAVHSVKGLVDFTRTAAGFAKENPALAKGLGPGGMVLGQYGSDTGLALLDYASRSLDEVSREMSIYNPNFLDKLEQSVTSIASFYGLGALLGGPVASFTEIAMEMGGTYDEALKAGKPRPEALRAAGADLIWNILVKKVTGTTESYFGESKKDVVEKFIVRPFLREGPEETLQKLGSDFLAKGTIDPAGLREEYLFAALGTLALGPVDAGGAEAIVQRDNVGGVYNLAQELDMPVEELISGLGFVKTQEVEGTVEQKQEVQYNEVQLTDRQQRRYDVLKYAQDNDINLPISATADSAALRNLEAAAQKSWFGKPVEETVTKAYNAILDQNKSIQQDLLKDKPNASELGNMLEESITAYKDSYLDEKSQLYKAVPSEVWTAPASTENTQRVLKSIIAQKENSAFSKNKEMYKDLLEEIEGGGDLRWLRNTKANIDGYKGSNDPIVTGDRAQLRRLYAAILQDTDNTLNTLDKNAGDLLRNADIVYAAHIDLITSGVGKNLFKQSSDNLTRYITPGEYNKTANLKQILMANPETWDLVQAQFVSELVIKSTNKKGYLDPVTFEKNINKYGRDELELLFNDSQLAGLDGIRKELDLLGKNKEFMDKYSKVSEGSQTAFVQNIQRAVFGTASVMPLIFQPHLLVLNLAGQYAITKMMQTDGGKKTLLKIFDKKTLEMIENIEAGNDTVEQGLPVKPPKLGEEGFASLRTTQDLIDMVKNGEATYDKASGQVKQKSGDNQFNIGKLTVKQARDAGIIPPLESNKPSIKLE